MEGSSPELSVIVPVYNGERYLRECAQSVLQQPYKDLQLLLVDDCSTDSSPLVIQELAQADRRVVPMRLPKNSGTLTARQAGVGRSTGRFVMLVDQDDELAPGALPKIMAHKHDAQIVHFGVTVVPEGAAAEQAAAGMQRFLTPEPRVLRSLDIMRVQFAAHGNFDWHVHHKLFDGNLARRAWNMAAHTRLLLSDDIYLCMIIDAMAQSYAGIADSPWYLYHLGRGDTLGAQETMETLRRTSEREAKGWKLMRDFAAAHSSDIPRSDWNDRVADARDRIYENVSNEMVDGLQASQLVAAVSMLLTQWPADAVAAELWRYVRDRAYERYDRHIEPQRNDALGQMLALTLDVDAHVDQTSASVRYRAMKDAATVHLRELAERYPQHRSWLLAQYAASWGKHRGFLSRLFNGRS